jgi:hypothetical protein
MAVPQQTAIEALDVASLAEEYGVRDLESLLAREGVPLFGKQDERKVAEESWRAFVGVALQRLAAAATLNGARGGATPASGNGGAWHPHYKQWLDKRPGHAKLLAEFTRAVLERIPGTTMQQNKTTVTFYLPNGRRFGLWLRTEGLYLHATRNKDKKERTLNLDDSVDDAVNWVRQLPG